MTQRHPAPQPPTPQAVIPPKRKKRHIFLWLLVIVIATWLFQNYTIKIEEDTISSSKIQDPIRIVALSDLHASEWNISNKRILKAIDEQKPDLIVVLGDMYTDSEDPTVSQALALSFLEELVFLCDRVYFVAGEHDRRIQYYEALSTAGIHVLNDAAETIQIRNTTLQLFGSDAAYFPPDYDLTAVLPKPDPNLYSILLAHIPNYDCYEAFGADLSLCGDTHGEVVQLPLLGPLYDNNTGQLLPELTMDPRQVYDKGMFSYVGGKLFITSGLGNYPSFPLRFHNHPEIAVLTLEPETE